MDGFEVARNVRALRTSTNVLFMSGHLGNAYAADVTLTRARFSPSPLPQRI
jgi:hypothetical protein